MTARAGLLKAFPEQLLTGLPQPVRDWMRSLHAEVMALRNSVDSAAGELLGGEDVTGAIPADSTAVTVADLRADHNALLAVLRSL